MSIKYANIRSVMAKSLPLHPDQLNEHAAHLYETKMRMFEGHVKGNWLPFTGDTSEAEAIIRKAYAGFIIGRLIDLPDDGLLLAAAKADRDFQPNKAMLELMRERTDKLTSAYNLSRFWEIGTQYVGLQVEANGLEVDVEFNPADFMHVDDEGNRKARSSIDTNRIEVGINFTQTDETGAETYHSYYLRFSKLPKEQTPAGEKPLVGLAIFYHEDSGESIRLFDPYEEHQELIQRAIGSAAAHVSEPQGS